MVVQDELMIRIEKFIKRQKQIRNWDHIEFKVTKSKTTNSIYVKAISYWEGERIQSSYRISDHRNSKVTTKVLAKNTKFSFIEKKIVGLVEKIDRIRFRKKLEQLGEKK